jgi:hypothetical protein
MKRSFWNELCLKGHGLKLSEKLRIWWFAVSLVVMGTVVDDVSWWLLLMLSANFIASCMSMLSLSKKIQGDEKEEI